MNYIIYDLEATCWENPPANFVQETIEIGAFKVNAFGEVVSKFNRFIQPVVHPRLSPFCIQLTGIRQIDVQRANTFPEVADEFLDWATDNPDEDDYTLCSWGSFDRKMLRNDCRLHRMEESWTDKHVNLKEQYRHLKGIRHKRGLGLQYTVEQEGFLFTGQPHRGISDAENLLKLFLKYLGSWQF